MPKKMSRKVSKKMSKMSEKMLKHNPMKAVSKVLEGKMVRNVLVVALIVYSGLLVPGFHSSIAPLFDSWVVRGLFILTIVAVAPQDPLLGVLLVLALGVSMFVNQNNSQMRTMLEEDEEGGQGGQVAELSRKLGESADSLGQVVSRPLGAVVDVSGQAVSGTVGLATGVVGGADRATGGVVSGAVRGTERVARGVVSDIAGGLGRADVNTPAGFNIGYKDCVNGKGNSLCKGVGNVGLQTQGLGVPVGDPGATIGAVY